MIDWVHHPDGCVNPVHLFTKLDALLLTKSRGFPTPRPNERLRDPGVLWTMHVTFAGGNDASGELGLRCP